MTVSLDAARLPIKVFGDQMVISEHKSIITLGGIRWSRCQINTSQVHKLCLLTRIACLSSFVKVDCCKIDDLSMRSLINKEIPLIVELHLKKKTLCMFVELL